MPRQHDLGGALGGAIDLADHDAEPWHKMLTAVVGALRVRGYLTVDELRRALEDLPSDEYDRGYFERWAEAATNLLEEKDVLTRAEVVARMGRIRQRLDAAE